MARTHEARLCTRVHNLPCQHWYLLTLPPKLLCQTLCCETGRVGCLGGQCRWKTSSPKQFFCNIPGVYR